VRLGQRAREVEQDRLDALRRDGLRHLEVALEAQTLDELADDAVRRTVEHVVENAHVGRGREPVGHLDLLLERLFAVPDQRRRDQRLHGHDPVLDLGISGLVDDRRAAGPDLVDDLVSLAHSLVDLRAEVAAVVARHRRQLAQPVEDLPADGGDHPVHLGNGEAFERLRRVARRLEIRELGVLDERRGDGDPVQRQIAVVGRAQETPEFDVAYEHRVQEIRGDEQQPHLRRLEGFADLGRPLLTRLKLLVAPYGHQPLRLGGTQRRAELLHPLRVLVRVADEDLVAHQVLHGISAARGRSEVSIRSLSVQE
jgi:hypothetical protein